MEAIGIDCGALGRAVALITEIFSRRRYLNYHTWHHLSNKLDTVLIVFLNGPLPASDKIC